ncbi:unnamed protein product [Strongylus vulgaris]|uniref:Transposase Helix-turn-helix domain-containing protein n=1 Tax=Strongylus vulgaris TaxID=40348 RepID=A0A3P7L6R7_STRVU|nr:unnamed protein product [Strongylus vulgaris]
MATLFFSTSRGRAANLRYQRIYPALVFRRNDRIFYSKYRFRVSDVEQIVKMLSPLLPDSGLLPWEVTKEDQVLITLRYLATNSHQTVIADCFGISQKAVSDVVTRVVEALNHPDIEARFLRSGLLMNGGACEDLENLPRTRDLRHVATYFNGLKNKWQILLHSTFGKKNAPTFFILLVRALQGNWFLCSCFIFQKIVMVKSGIEK